MSPNSLPIDLDTNRLAVAARPEDAWISHGSTLNPSPGTLLKERRDTAQGCRSREAPPVGRCAPKCCNALKQELQRG